MKKLVRLRIVTILANLKHFRKLKKNNRFYKKYGIRKKLWQNISHEAIPRHDDEMPWLDGSATSESIQLKPQFHSFPSSVQEQILTWKERGYISLKNFFDVKKIEQTEASIIKGLSQKQTHKYLTDRMMNLYKTNPWVNTIFHDPQLLGLLSFILGREALPYQTINFHISSSQPAHSDSLHLTTEPLGYLIGVWVALEDITPGCGQFFIYPGSHRLPYVMNEDFKHKNNFWKLDDHLHEKYEEKIAEVMEQSGMPTLDYLPQKGDVLIWHANLIHGSRPKLNPSLTRKSLVMHYFAKDVLCYHESMEKPIFFKS